MRWSLVGVVIALAMIALAVPVGSFDLPWHLVLGEYVLDHGEVARHALHTSLPEDPVFKVNDWLGAALYALAYRASSWAGVALVKIAAVGALGAVLAVALRRRGAGTLELSTLLVVVYVGSIFRLTGERPVVIAYVCLVAMAALVFSGLATTWRGLAAAFCVQVVWTQVHGNALVGPVLGGCLLAGIIARRLLPGRLSVLSVDAEDATVPRGFLLVALLIVGQSLGPVGPEYLLGYISPDAPVWEMAGEQHKLTPEWEPTGFEHLFGKIPLTGLAVTFLSVFLLAGLARKQKLPAAELITVVAMIGLGSRAIRFVPEAILGAAIPIGGGLLASRGRWSARGQRALWAAALISCAGAWGVSLATDDMPRPVLRERRAWYPTAASRVLLHAPDGVVCNHFEFGGYLLHELAPRVRPFIDGRIVSAYPISHMVRSAAAFGSPQALEALATEEDLVGCVIAYPDPRTASLFDRRRWALVQLDDVSATYLRRDKASADWLLQRELTYLDPRDPFRSVRGAATSSVARAALLTDLERAEAITTERFLLTALRARLAADTGDPDAAALRARARSLFPGSESLRFGSVDVERFLDVR